MSCRRISSDSLGCLAGRVTVTQNGKDAYGRHAFLAGDLLSFCFFLPRELGVTHARMRFSSDERASLLTLPVTWTAREGTEDIYTLSLQTDTLGAGLYFCRIELDTVYGAVYAYGGNALRFARHEGEIPAVFQLTVSKPKHKAPSWILGGVIYHVFVDRFFRGGDAPPAEGTFINPDWENGIPQYPPYPGAPLANNMFFGGDLDGVTEKLPYIASLGTKAIYLSPIFRAASNHKYDTGDYAEVDAAFGGERALVRLIGEAEHYGIRIILDGVFNHTGADSIYFNRYGHYDSPGAYGSKDSPYADWYTFKEFPDRYEAWWGIEILPRLNLRAPSCREYFVGKEGIISKYAALGIGGMRLDVADELESDFIAAIKDRLCEKSEDAILYGEVWEDASNKIAYSRRCRYYLGEELDGVMNYPLRTGILRYLRYHDTSALSYYFGEVLLNMPKTAADAAMNLLGTHDTVRVLTALGGEEPEGKSNDELATLRMSPAARCRAVALLKAAYLIAATVPGVPAVYYGDEAGLEGYSDPFNRMPFPWSKMDESLLSYYRMMARVREDGLYRDGEMRLLRLDESLLAFSRENEQFAAVTVLNNGEQPITLLLPDGAEILTDQAAEDCRVCLAPLEGVVVKIGRDGHLILE